MTRESLLARGTLERQQPDPAGRREPQSGVAPPKAGVSSKLRDLLLGNAKSIPTPFCSDFF